MADVFISYSEEDRGEAETLAGLLEQHDLTVWWDRSLLPGQQFQARIEEELRSAGKVIVLWSPDSIESYWVQAEANRALAQDKLVTLSVRGVGSAEVPLPFNTVHILEIDDWRGGLPNILSALGVDPVESPPSPRSARASRPAAKLSCKLRPLRSLGDTGLSTHAARFSPDGRALASGHSYDTLVLWDLAKGEEVGRFQEKPIENTMKSVHGVDFSPNGRLLAAGCGDKRLRVWDRRSGGLLFARKEHSDEVSSVAFSPDGKTIASGCPPKLMKLWRAVQTLNLWDAKSGNVLNNFDFYEAGVSSLVFSRDGESLITAGLGGIQSWDPSTGQKIRKFSGSSSQSTGLSLSDDGETLLSYAPDGPLVLWNPETGQMLGSFEGHAESTSAAALSPDGRTAVSGDRSGELIFWDVQARQALQRVSDAHGNWVNSLAYSPDGRRLASGGFDGLKLWEVRNQ